MAAAIDPPPDTGRNWPTVAARGLLLAVAAMFFAIGWAPAASWRALLTGARWTRAAVAEGWAQGRRPHGKGGS